MYLLLIMKNPREYLDRLVNVHKYKLKGDEPLSFHLGCDFGRDPDGTLYYKPKKYIQKMVSTYEKMFPGETLRKQSSPLQSADHPELDETDFLDEEGIAKYMSMVGATQWLVTLGRFDVAIAVNTLSSYRVAPRIGHMDRMKRLYGYVKHFQDGAIRVRTGIPDYSELKGEEHDWLNSIYGNIDKELPQDMPTPLGKKVRISAFFDANLYHDLITGRAMTGVLMFVNKTPVDWYSKKQSTVATATFTLEFIAGRTMTDQVLDLQYTLRMLGVPLDYHTYAFGDNKPIITQSTVPESQLTKRWNALAFHRVREAVASGILKLYHIPGAENPSDVLTKFLGYQQAWPHLKPLLFWMGDTANISPKGSDT